jgi:hypothetical protein
VTIPLAHLAHRCCQRSLLEQLAKELNPFASDQLSAISDQLFVLAEG